MQTIIQHLAVAGFVGIMLGTYAFVIVEDFENWEAYRFDDPSKWIYRNPFR